MIVLDAGWVQPVGAAPVGPVVGVLDDDGHLSLMHSVTREPVYEGPVEVVAQHRDGPYLSTPAGLAHLRLDCPCTQIGGPARG